MSRSTNQPYQDGVPSALWSTIALMAGVIAVGFVLISNVNAWLGTAVILLALVGGVVLLRFRLKRQGWPETRSATDKRTQ